MSQHPNARLTPRGREMLVSRIRSSTSVAKAAHQMGVSRQTASKWLACTDLRQDRRWTRAAEARRRRPHDRGSPAPRSRHPDALRAGEA